MMKWLIISIILIMLLLYIFWYYPITIITFILCLSLIYSLLGVMSAIVSEMSEIDD